MAFDYKKFQSVKSRVAQGQADRKRYLREVQGFKKALAVVKAKIIAEQEAHEIFKAVSVNVMIKLQKKVSDLVTLGLRAVFPDPPEFVVDMVLRRDKLECDLLFKKNGELYDPVGGSGGGLLDVTSFALRVAYWSLKKTAPIFILDEPFKYVSPDLQPKVEKMLKMFSDELKVQIIMVSHSDHVLPQTENDRVFVITQKDKFSQVGV